MHVVLCSVFNISFLQKTKKDGKGKKRRAKGEEEEQPAAAVATTTGSELMELEIETPKEVGRVCGWHGNVCLLRCSHYKHIIL